MKKIYYNSLGVCLMLLTLISCSATKQVEPSRFKVTVSSNGKSLNNFDQNLIHRVELDSKSLNKIFGSSPEELREIVDLDIKKDLAGAIVGLTIKEIKSNKDIKKLALLEEDVLISIGTVRLVDYEDFWHLKEVLRIDGNAGLTIIRHGQVNKILYFINE